MVYEGDQDYIFISYSHRDAQQVNPIIAALQKQGFRIWYDSGIEPGTEWPEYIAEHIDSCSSFLALISDNSSKSPNCRQEIHRAIHLRKEILVVYLEQVNLSPGMEMRLDPLQAIKRWKYEKEEAFIAALCGARILQSCKGVVPPNQPDGNLNESLSGNRLKHIEPSSDAIRKYECGLAHYYGKGVERDYVVAIQLLDEAAEEGLDEKRAADLSEVLPRLCYWAGRQCADSADGGQSKLAEAASFLKRSAELGDPYGACELGRYYRDGRGVPADSVKALEYSKKAAEMGDFGGNYDLGLCYSKGIGVPRDYLQAAAFYEKASSCEPSSSHSKAIALTKAIESYIQAGNHAKAKKIVDNMRSLLDRSDNPREAKLLQRTSAIELDTVAVRTADYTRDFLSKSDAAMSMYKTDGGVVVYDMDISKEGVKEGQVLYLSSEGDAGLRYILQNGYPYKTYRNNKGMDAYITQMAIWWYISESLSTDFRYADETTDEYKLVPVARKLVSSAREIAQANGDSAMLDSGKKAKIYSSSEAASARVIGLFD